MAEAPIDAVTVASVTKPHQFIKVDNIFYRLNCLSRLIILNQFSAKGTLVPRRKYKLQDLAVFQVYGREYMEYVPERAENANLLHADATLASTSTKLRSENLNPGKLSM